MAKVKSATQKMKVTERKSTVITNSTAITGEELIAKQQQRKEEAKAAKALKNERTKEKLYSPDEKTLTYVVVLSGLNIYTANLAFLRFPRPDFFEFITNVFAMMIENSNYPSPTPAIVTVQNEVKLYFTARGNKDTDVANQHFANIKYMMKQLGIYVANNCGNDLPAFNSSGFVSNKLKPGPMKSIGKAVIKNVKDTLH